MSGDDDSPLKPENQTRPYVPKASFMERLGRALGLGAKAPEDEDIPFNPYTSDPSFMGRFLESLADKPEDERVDAVAQALADTDADSDTKVAKAAGAEPKVGRAANVLLNAALLVPPGGLPMMAVLHKAGILNSKLALQDSGAMFGKLKDAAVAAGAGVVAAGGKAGAIVAGKVADLAHPPTPEERWDRAVAVATRAKASGNADWYFMLLAEALEFTHGDLGQAMDLADRALAERPAPDPGPNPTTP